MFRDFNKYEVYEDGRIWSYTSNKWMKSYPNHRGYLQVKLTDNYGNTKHYSLHRVVYEAVSGQPIPEGMQVNHIDEDKENNHISNLNLMTPKENTNWGTRNERLSKRVAQYDKEGNLLNVFSSTKEVERQLGFYSSVISECCNMKPHRKQGYGFIWRYLDSPTV